MSIYGDCGTRYTANSFLYELGREIIEYLKNNKDISSHNKDKVGTMIVSLTEALIWSDQNDFNLFE